MHATRLRAGPSGTHASMMLVAGATIELPHGSARGVHAARRDVSGLIGHAERTSARGTVFEGHLKAKYCSGKAERQPRSWAADRIRHGHPWLFSSPNRSFLWIVNGLLQGLNVGLRTHSPFSVARLLHGMQKSNALKATSTGETHLSVSRSALT